MGLERPLGARGMHRSPDVVPLQVQPFEEPIGLQKRKTHPHPYRKRKTKGNAVANGSISDGLSLGFSGRVGRAAGCPRPSRGPGIRPLARARGLVTCSTWGTERPQTIIPAGGVPYALLWQASTCLWTLRARKLANSRILRGNQSADPPKNT